MEDMGLGCNLNPETLCLWRVQVCRARARNPWHLGGGEHVDDMGLRGKTLLLLKILKTLNLCKKMEGPGTLEKEDKRRSWG